MTEALVKQGSQALDLYTREEIVEDLKQNPDSHLALELAKNWLLKEVNQYAEIDFESALKDLERKDNIEYRMVKMLLEDFVRKNGQIISGNFLCCSWQ